MNVKKLLFNNVTSGGGDTPSATLTQDQLICHLDAKDISLKNWNDRMGNYNFTTSSLSSSFNNRFNLNGYNATSTNFTFGSFPFTLEFTVSITATSAWGNLFSTNKDVTLFQINHRNNGYYGVNSKYVSPNPIYKVLDAAKVNDGTLHILDFMFVSSKELIVYLDGVKQSDITAHTFKDTLLGLVGYIIGSKGNSTITGYLYSFRFYKKELSEYEIRCNCLYEATQGRTDVSSDTEQSYFLKKWN